MNRQKFAVVMVCGILVFIVMAINITQVGGRDLITLVNNLSLLVFLIFGTVQALVYWRSIQNREDANRVWLVLGLGLGLYGLGQMSWMIYNLLGVEVPYPSLGDLFWLLAYPLLVVAVLNKNILLGVTPTKNQVVAIVLFGLFLFLLIGNFILLPMVKYAATARVVETFLNLFYPIMDFLILVAVSFLVIILWKGRLSLTWNIIAAGFLFLAVADVFFIYATWNGLYYAEGTNVNLLTRFVDVSYTLSAFLIATGEYLHQWAVTIQPETMEFEFTQTIIAEQSKVPPKPITPDIQTVLGKVFFMVDGEQNVYFFSQYYRELWQLLEGKAHTVGTPLHSVLGVDPSIVKKIFSDIQPGKTSATPIEILIGATYIPILLKVTHARNGCDVFLQYRVVDKPVITEEQKTIDTILVEETLRSVQGMENSSTDIRGATAFFLIEVQEMYLFLVRMGGYRVGQVLVDRFNKAAANQKSGVRIIDGRVILTDVLDSKRMFNLLQLTLRTVQELASTEATSKVVKHLNEKIPESIVRSAQNVGLAL